MITFEIKSERNISFKALHYLYHRRGRKAYRSWHPNGKKHYEEYRINSIYQNSKYWNEQGELL